MELDTRLRGQDVETAAAFAFSVLGFGNIDCSDCRAKARPTLLSFTCRSDFSPSEKTSRHSYHMELDTRLRGHDVETAAAFAFHVLGFGNIDCSDCRAKARPTLLSFTCRSDFSPSEKTSRLSCHMELDTRLRGHDIETAAAFAFSVLGF